MPRRDKKLKAQKTAKIAENPKPAKSAKIAKEPLLEGGSLAWRISVLDREGPFGWSLKAPTNFMKSLHGFMSLRASNGAR
jgi:hypothetical protein